MIGIKQARVSMETKEAAVRITIIASMVLVLVLSVSVAAEAQGDDRFVGPWERISLKNAQGESIQPPAGSAKLIFTPNGYYAQVVARQGRGKVAKPLAEMTKEELLDRYGQFNGRWGTYTVSGNVLTRTDLIAANPNQEGVPGPQNFRFEGDLLILTRDDNMSEARFRRIQ